MKLLLFTLGLSVAFISVSFAELTVAPIFTDNAVLQRDTSVPVWGMAEPGEAITINYGEQTKTTVANSETGRWKTMLDPLIASAEPRSLEVVAEEEALTFSNVIVGEVWLASGQSNMAMRVDLAHDPKKEKANLLKSKKKTAVLTELLSEFICPRGGARYILNVKTLSRCAKK